MGHKGGSPPQAGGMGVAGPPPPKPIGGGFGHLHLATRGWLYHPQSSHKGSRALEPPLLAQWGWSATPTNLFFWRFFYFFISIIIIIIIIFVLFCFWFFVPPKKRKNRRIVFFAIVKYIGGVDCHFLNIRRKNANEWILQGVNCISSLPPFYSNLSLI
jgi:hypothetical protein